jgi:hypothetical protein
MHAVFSSPTLQISVAEQHYFDAAMFGFRCHKVTAKTVYTVLM